MRFFLALALLIASSPCYALDQIPNAKAAEFSLHRVERLVILHKLDASYQTHFQRIELSMGTVQKPGDPTFIIRESEIPGADGTSMTVDLTFDEIGRPINQTANAGPPSVDPPAYPDKDAITIAENSLHWIEDQGPVVDELRSFFTSVIALELSPVTDGRGTLTGAEVTMVVSRDKPSLLVAMGLDGVFKSYQILPPVAQQ